MTTAAAAVDPREREQCETVAYRVSTLRKMHSAVGRRVKESEAIAKQALCEFRDLPDDVVERSAGADATALMLVSWAYFAREWKVLHLDPNSKDVTIASDALQDPVLHKKVEEVNKRFRRETPQPSVAAPPPDDGLQGTLE